ncbi:lysophospholipid acyltransferase family protein [Flavobacteriaceae bacterium S356]|uniref:Lysophospholipid acyltransferase family protein n=1 Tax=Asprobacillus argus TaxID=3076534 RepID=A0ABU3LIB8_9FLAO|nr:lysophospholipid acyltransferase family protein [Flavobacteriaceae bacterium S356]
MKTLWYYSFRILVKTALFFYIKRIKVEGKEHIPQKGAVLFTVNHPNALIDPLLVATTNRRMQHFLVRAASFKNPTIKKLLATLNLMPIYRIRDGVKELAKNEAIFDQCFSIFKKGQALMIFPEGSHNIKRTIRPISKGFTRIVFGAIDRYPDLKITIIPVGITYQNPSEYPTSVSIKYGTPIIANDHYDINNIPAATLSLRTQVREQLKKMVVHIPNNEKYQDVLDQLNNAHTDYTEVANVNSIISDGTITSKTKKYHYFLPLKILIVLNSLLPWLLWKHIAKKVDEIEFVDTFRFGINVVTFPLFYGIQTWIVSLLFGWKIGLIYLGTSLVLLLIYTKFESIPPKSIPE